MGCGLRSTKSESERSKHIHAFCFLNAGAQRQAASYSYCLSSSHAHCHDGLQKGKINPPLLKCFSQVLILFNNNKESSFWSTITLNTALTMGHLLYPYLIYLFVLSPSAWKLKKKKHESSTITLIPVAGGPELSP